jgi:hypothetical protein
MVDGGRDEQTAGLWKRTRLVIVSGFVVCMVELEAFR